MHRIQRDCPNWHGYGQHSWLDQSDSRTGHLWCNRCRNPHHKQSASRHRCADDRLQRRPELPDHPRNECSSCLESRNEAVVSSPRPGSNPVAVSHRSGDAMKRLVTALALITLIWAVPQAVGQTVGAPSGLSYVQTIKRAATSTTLNSSSSVVGPTDPLTLTAVLSYPTSGRQRAM